MLRASSNTEDERTFGKIWGVNLTLEAIDANAMDVELIAECVAAAASVLAPDDNFDVVIAGDFVAAIRSRTDDEHERASYVTDRTFGEAAARALTGLEPPVIVVHAGVVVKDGDRETALQTFEHEALHVLTARRGESLSDVRRRHNVVGVARNTFLAVAGMAAEEFRVVRALAQSRGELAVDFKTYLATSLESFLEVIWSASDARTAGGSVESYCESVMTAFSHLVTMLAYLAAVQTGAFASEAPLWSQWIAPTWPQLHELLSRLPPADEEADVTMLDALVVELADTLPSLLADIGFTAKDTDVEKGEVWFGPV